MTRKTTRRGFLQGVAGAGAAGAAGTAAAQQETETDDGGGTGTDGAGTPTDGGEGTDGGGEGTGTDGGGGTEGGGTGTDGEGTAGGEGTDGGGGGGGGEPDFEGWFDDVSNYDGSVDDMRGQGDPEVSVGVEANDGNFGFGPAAIHVDNGATVTWTWTGEGDPHNVVEEEEVFSSGEPESGEGTTYEYTFEEDGIYRYVCEPHIDLGMKGAVVVGSDYPTVDTGGGGGGGGGRPQVPDTARTLGVATSVAMAATLGLAYVFMKFGGDYGDFDEK